MASNGISDTKTAEPVSLAANQPISSNFNPPVAGQTEVLAPSSSDQLPLNQPDKSLFQPGVISEISSYFSKKKYDKKITDMETHGEKVNFPEWLKLMAISRVNNNTIMSGKFYTIVWASSTLMIANLYLLLIQDGIINTSRWAHVAANHGLASLFAIGTTCIFAWEHGRYSDSLRKYFKDNKITVYSSGTGDILITRELSEEKYEYQKLHMP